MRKIDFKIVISSYDEIEYYNELWIKLSNIDLKELNCSNYTLNLLISIWSNIGWTIGAASFVWCESHFQFRVEKRKRL